MDEQPLAIPPSSPDPQDLEARLTRVEEDVRELKADVKSVLKDLAYLRGRVEHLPTTWMLVTTITTSQAALLGFTFAMLRFFGPHP